MTMILQAEAIVRDYFYRARARDEGTEGYRMALRKECKNKL
ncbi:MAG: hypothetical protein SOX85_12545 [Lachnospiraceae bacterium]|nr:hypothetical protein [Lachnospiraceae bacterium]